MVLLFWSSHLCFFFKQKTAYEMRISDWSSDVCSSDLFHLGRHLFGFHLIKDVTESKVCAQLYVPASDRAFFHVHAKHRQLKRHLHATSPSRTAAQIAASTIASSGITAFSRWGANGIATSCTVTRRTGPRNEAKPCSATIAAISLAALHVARASSRITRRPVLRTEARISSLSSGKSVIGSTTSTSIPSSDNVAAARIA